MAFGKSRQTQANKFISKEMEKEVLKEIVDEFSRKNEIAVGAFSRLDESMSKYLSSTAAYYYFLLSITTACIGYTITLTVNAKFRLADLLILISLALWMVSFNYGLQSVNRTNKIILNHNFYILGIMMKSKEISEPYKQMLDELGNESSGRTKSPLFYLLLGVFSFIIWYLINVFSN